MKKIMESKTMKNIYSSPRKEYGSLAFLLILSMFLVAPKNIKADGDVELSGKIEAKTAATITVNSIKVTVNSTTIILSSLTHKTLTLDSLKIGSLVHVDVVSQGNGLLTASKILLMDERTTFRFDGLITAVSTNSFTINGLNLMVDTSTVFYTQFHATLKFSDLKTGYLVSVNATQKSGGTYLAVSVLVITKNSDQEVEFEGSVQAITSNSLKVHNTVFFVDSKTIILQDEKGVIPFNQILVGDKVEIRGILRSDSTYLALRIKVDNEKPVQRKLELEGAVTKIGSNTFEVSGVTCHTDSSTVIFNSDGALMNFSDLKLGNRVEVKALLQSNNTYLALRVELEEDETRREFEVEGAIQTLASNNLTVGGNTIFINSQTKIYNQLNQNVLFSSLKVGTFVHIKAAMQNNTYYALFIKVQENNAISNFSGPIESISGNTIYIKGLVFITNQSTEFLDDDRNPITLSDLKAGQFVNIKATLQAGSQYLALRVIAKNFWRPTISARGTIDNLTLSFLTVMGKTFTVDSSTKVIGTEAGVISFSSLTLGMEVEVKGSLNTGGVLMAKLIKVRPAHEFTLHGKITSITGTQFVIAGLTIKTDRNTAYFDQFDKSVTFDSLKVNQLVEVEYVKTVLNENLAVKIEIEKGPNSVVITDVVTSSTSGSLQLSAANVIVNSNTSFLSSSFAQIQSTSLKTGETITIWANQNSNGSLSAVQVMQVSGSVTDVKESQSGNLPSDFDLKQNYPNPFNPETSIEFTLLKQAKVTLEVYNILAQKVATLTNEVMDAGTHIVKFNAANFSSGVYFYKMKAGDFISIKKMLLLK